MTWVWKEVGRRMKSDQDRDFTLTLPTCSKKLEDKTAWERFLIRKFWDDWDESKMIYSEGQEKKVLYRGMYLTPYDDETRKGAELLDKKYGINKKGFKKRDKIGMYGRFKYKCICNKDGQYEWASVSIPITQAIVFKIINTEYVDFMWRDSGKSPIIK